MGKKFEEKPKAENPITLDELKRYEVNISMLPQKRIEGILVSSREQYLISIGALKIIDGSFVVIDAPAIMRIDELDALVPRQKHIPSKEWWADVKGFIKAIEARIMPQPDYDEIPF